MKTVTFWQGIAIAVIASVIGSIGYFALAILLSNHLSLRLLISVLTLTYILYLFSRSQKRVGRISALLLWLVVITAAWLLQVPLAVFLLMHVSSIWLIRSLYFYNSLMMSLADLGLNIFGVTSAFWAFFHTGSLFLAIWCFFLVEALFVFLPKKSTRLDENSGLSSNNEDFENAYKTADAALRKLSALG